MFRPQVLRRGFSSFTRLSDRRIIRSAARDGHQSINIQRVHIRKPFWGRSARWGCNILMVGIVAYVAGDWLPSGKNEEEGKDNRRSSNQPQRPRLRGVEVTKDLGSGLTDLEVNSEDEDVENFPLLFLPTGFSRPKPATYYKGSDPEWQEFIRIAPDRKRMLQIKKDLVTIIRSGAVDNPSWVRALGKIKPNEGGSWMEHKFPDGPPVEYERPGVELTSDLHWRKTTRPVAEIHHERLGHLLQPTAVASPLYNDWRRRAGESWNGFKSYLGWGGKPDPVSVPPLAQTPPSNPMSFARPPPPPSAPSSSSPPKESTDSPASAESDTQKSQVSSSSSSIPLQDQKSARRLAYLKNASLDLSQFRREVKKARKPLRLQPPRGTFLLFGIVEVRGERAYLSLDVAAAYDPKTNDFVMMTFGVRNFTEYRQRPKGGP